MSEVVRDGLNKLPRDRNALRPDAQAFDEIRIVTVPRYKTSGLSGDEWRISAEIQFYRKGELKHRTSYSTVEHACGFLYSAYHEAIGEGRAYFAGDGVHCDQEGCVKPKTVTYRILKHFCQDGEEHRPSELHALRHFCAEHKTRGDCALEDADRNYELAR
jgi:hypothetical protein